MPRLSCVAVPTLAALSLLAGCSVRPQYQVRVVNESSVTVAAMLRRDVAMADDQTLAQATVRPGGEATLGPVEADPLDPVELVVARPTDIQTLTTDRRLSRGNWTALVSDAGPDSWSRFSVTLTKE